MFAEHFYGKQNARKLFFEVEVDNYDGFEREEKVISDLKKYFYDTDDYESEQQNDNHTSFWGQLIGLEKE